MYLNTTKVYCEIDPYYLPNNKTDNCTEQVFKDNQVFDV